MSSDYRSGVDTERCYFCPARHGVQVHHIVPQRFRGSDDRENLVAVCEKCHGKLEALYDAGFYKALGITDAPGERKAHFPCCRSACSNQAAIKVGFGDGVAKWYCRDCGAPIVEYGGPTEVLEEVSR